MSDVTSTFDLVKNLVNQFINFVPLGIYFFAYFTAIVFNDMRGGIIMLGMFLNDLVGIFYNKYVGLVDKKPACAVFATSEDDVIELPNKHTEIVSFFSSFFYSEMYNKKDTNWFRFIFLLILIIITVWSRMNVGCENDMTKIIFSILSGATRGILFYYFFSKQWNDLSDKSCPEKVACDYESNKYSCETIKNGNVIIKGAIDDDEPLDENNN